MDLFARRLLLQMERNYSLHGVRICCVCPTNVRTDLLPQAARAFFPEHTLESFKHIHDSLKYVKIHVYI